MFKQLFTKYIDLSSNKFKHMLKKLDEAKTLDAAFDVVKKDIVLTDYIIEKIKADAKGFDKDEAKAVDESKDADAEALAAAEAEAARVKAEAEAAGAAARSQGESSADY